MAQVTQVKTPAWKTRRKQLDEQRKMIDQLRAQASTPAAQGQMIGGGGGGDIFGARPGIYAGGADEWTAGAQALQGLLAGLGERKLSEQERTYESDMEADKAAWLEQLFATPDVAQGAAVPVTPPSGGAMPGMPPAMGMPQSGGAPVNPPLGAAQARPALPLSAPPTSTQAQAATLGAMPSGISASSSADPERELMDQMERQRLLEEADAQINRNALLLGKPAEGPFVKGAQVSLPQATGIAPTPQRPDQLRGQPRPPVSVIPASIDAMLSGNSGLPGDYSKEANLQGLVGDIPPEQPKQVHLNELDRELARTTDPVAKKMLLEERAKLTAMPLTVPQAVGTAPAIVAESSSIPQLPPVSGLLQEADDQIERNNKLLAQPTAPASVLPQAMRVAGGGDDEWKRMMRWAGGAASNPLMNALASEVWNKGAATLSDMSRDTNKEMVKAQMKGLGLDPDDPAAVREFKYFMTLDASHREQYLAVKRAAQTLNLGGTQAVLGPTGGIKEQYAVTPKPEQMPSFQGAQQQAIEQAKAGVEKETNRPAADAAYRSAIAKSDATTKAIDDILKDINWKSAGVTAQVSAEIGETPAYNLKAKLTSLGAKLAFEAMADLKAASPTGATGLGAIAIKEFEALQSAVGAIDQFQDPEQLKDQLRIIKSHTRNIRNLIEQAHKEKWGDVAPAQTPAAPATAVPQKALKRYNPTTGRIE
jgi:hypothetical protein